MDVQLDFTEGRLFVRATSDLSCTLGAEVDGRRYVLGADAPDVVARKLRVALEEPPAALTCVLTLFEQHASFFVEQRGDASHWMVQGEDGAVLFRFALSRVERRRWLDVLVGRDRA